jgi:DNA-binding CsgD family transcriptional regulator
MAEPGEPLTERELEILRYVATGLSNKEIAHRLHISTNTVKVHLRNIFTKLEVVSRTEAAMLAVRQGWVAVAGDHLAPEEEGGAEAVPSVSPTPAAEAPAVVVEPPLPWFYRVALIVAALIAIGVAVLAWPRPAPSAPAAAGLLPSRSETATSGVGLSPASRWMERAQMPTRRAWLAVASWERRLLTIAGETPEGVTGAVELYTRPPIPGRGVPPNRPLSPTPVRLCWGTGCSSPAAARTTGRHSP